ncbi:hypothetical protein Afil01_31170 [Actinorhabdospora filicis]|uniref:Uncharacterized protein n=1 Tax=Actinorhabdospora filicis TaxID=1785913 RepID=A0A9W6SJR0_9ACTN|nr:hypothetical protein [Actinorhabdospora filicis]GLZ78310.1 hypothetical protein Afil01_31170 [Actinorhabdospora filicis]
MSDTPLHPWGGNLDVPLSVLPTGTGPGRSLPDALLDIYAPRAGIIIDTTALMLPVAAARGHRCFCLVADAQIADTENTLLRLPADARGWGQVRRVDTEYLPDAIAAFVCDVDLLTTTDTATLQPGWWPACRHALAPTGHVAVLSGTGSDTHALLVDNARTAGFGYQQHLIAVPAPTLDISTGAPGTPRHHRIHRDIFVFTPPRTRP